MIVHRFRSYFTSHSPKRIYHYTRLFQYHEKEKLHHAAPYWSTSVNTTKSSLADHKYASHFTKNSALCVELCPIILLLGGGGGGIILFDSILSKILFSTVYYS